MIDVTAVITTDGQTHCMFYESLLQSEWWQAFQERNGKRCLREGGTLVVLETLPLVGRYLYAPRWPSQNQLSNFKNQQSGIENLANESRAGWLRVEPESEEVLALLKQEFGTAQVVPAPHDVQPREILVMDITQAEEMLLAEMKPKTRYNIRVAEKHGVSIRFSHAAADLEHFIELVYATTERKTIRPHTKDYYRNFFAVFPESACVLALAEHAGQVLAANLLVFHEGTAYYLHGGSSDEGRHRMAPHLLQWASIVEARRRDCQRYDFGGVRTESGTPSSFPVTSDWAGITRFKLGFSPKAATLSFLGAYDIVISPWRYRAYMALRKVQTLRKRLFI